MSDNMLPDEEDIALFRQTVGAIRPVKQNTVLPTNQKPKPRPLQREADQQTALEKISHSQTQIGTVAAEEKLLFKRAGMQNRTLQRLRRGQFTVDAKLDLHGMTVATATSKLAAFLTECTNTGRRCVHIIHGKGHGSKDGKPVIKNEINQWLRQRDEILAFCSARPMDGGTGAIYVLIKKAPPTM